MSYDNGFATMGIERVVSVYDGLGKVGNDL